MILLSDLSLEPCPRPLELLWHIWIKCFHHKELIPEDQSKVLHLEFDLEKPQFLSLILVIVKVWPLV